MDGGRAGPLAVSVETFETYQRTQAWLWEHMALTRARPVAGPLDLSGRWSLLALDRPCVGARARACVCDCVLNVPRVGCARRHNAEPCAEAPSKRKASRGER